jgi:hypothetical protein
VTLFSGLQYDGVKAALLQNEQPPLPTVPSRFGQVKPALMATFWMRPPVSARK